MFTRAQMERYYEGIEYYQSDGQGNQEIVPPRTFNVNDYPNYPVQGDEFGNGDMLVLGFVAQDLEECECGHSHITYAGIREDGMIGPMVTSNTIGEAMLNHPELDPISIMLGIVDPDEIKDTPGIAPDWDAMREVTPDEWPAESVEPKTDMTAFEF